jgi:ferrous iron transport protein A
MNFQDLVAGDTARIIGFDNTGRAYRKRLLAMGLTPGTEFEVSRFAPMGDPVQITLRGFSLFLRKEEGNVLLLEPVVNTNSHDCGSCRSFYCSEK